MFAAILCGLLALAPLCQAANIVVGGFTNYFTGVADTNYWIAYPVGAVDAVTGRVNVLGVGIRKTPAANGTYTNFFATGNYYVTNSVLGQGYLFRSPDSGQTQYNSWQHPCLISGLGTFVTIISATNLVTYDGITNTLGYVPAPNVSFIIVSNQLITTGSNLTNYAANIGLNLTNFSQLIGTSLTNVITLQGTTITNYIATNGLVITNAITNQGTALTNFGNNVIGAAATNKANAVGTSVTNAIAGQGTAITNFIGSSISTSNAAQGTVITNYIATRISFATNFAGTNVITLSQLPASIIAGGNATNALPMTYSTNNLQVMGGGSLGTAGGYIWSGSAYTNRNQSAFAVTNSGGTWYVYSNSTALYSSASPNGTWATVAGSAPVPTSAYAGTSTLTGYDIQGFVGSTNITAQITTPLLAQGTAQTNHTTTQGTAVTNALSAQGTAITNAVAAQGTAITNAITTQGTAVTNFGNLVIGAAATNKANAVGTSITNLLTAQYLVKTNGTSYGQTLTGVALVTNLSSIADPSQYIDLGDGIRPLSIHDDEGEGIRIIDSGGLGYIGISAPDMFITNHVGITTGGLDVVGAITGTSLAGTGASITALNAANLSSGLIPLARLSNSVPLTNLANTFTGSNYIANSLRVASNIYAATIAGEGSGISNLTGVNIQATTINSNVFNVATSNALFNNTIYSTIQANTYISNKGAMFWPAMADTTYGGLLYIKPTGGAQPSQVTNLLYNGSTTSFLDATGSWNTSVASTMLPVKLQTLNTNDGGNLTNLNASVIASGQVPTARAAWAVQATNGYAKGLTNESLNICDRFGAASSIHFVSQGDVQDLIMSQDGNGKLGLTGLGAASIQVEAFLRSSFVCSPTNVGKLYANGALIGSGLVTNTFYTNSTIATSIDTNTLAQRFLLTAAVGSASAGRCMLLVDRGGGYRTNGIASGQATNTLTAIIGPSDKYILTNVDAATFTVVAFERTGL